MEIAMILLLIFGAINIWFWIYNCRYHSAIAERELELDKHEVSLDEREQRNREDFLTLASMEDEWREIKSSYVVTGADEMRYNTEKAIYNVARSRIAHNIAYDIIHKFDPDVKTTEDGRMILTYKLKVHK